METGNLILFSFMKKKKKSLAEAFFLFTVHVFIFPKCRLFQYEHRCLLNPTVILQ